MKIYHEWCIRNKAKLQRTKEMELIFFEHELHIALGPRNSIEVVVFLEKAFILQSLGDFIMYLALLWATASPSSLFLSPPTIKSLVA